MAQKKKGKASKPAQQEIVLGPCLSDFTPALPNELLIHIGRQFRGPYAARDLASLRLTCRKFTSVYRKQMLGHAIIDIYLDPAGMRTLEWLASTPSLAPFIKHMTIGIRRVANMPFIVKRTSNIPRYANGEVSVLQEARELGRISKALKLMTTGATFDFRAVKVYLDQEGLTIRNELGPYGCKMLDAKDDYTPSASVIDRFNRWIKKFPKLESISSSEEYKHFMMLLVDHEDYIVARWPVKDRQGMFTSIVPPAHCHCHGIICHGNRACKNIRTMSRFLLPDLHMITPRLIHPNIINKVPWFGTLTRFDINFLNVNNNECAQTSTPALHSLVDFLVHCKKLTHLRLGTRDEQDPVTTARAPIEWVLNELIRQRWEARLERLELSLVDPLALIPFLTAHQGSMNFLLVKRPAAKAPGTTKAQRQAFCALLQSMTDLSGTLSGYTYFQKGSAQSAKKMPHDVMTAEGMEDILGRIVREVEAE